MTTVYPCEIVCGMTEARLVSTKAAAEALGLHARTLWRNVAAGKITPHGWTPGGQMRWDIDRLRAELGHR